MPAGNVEPFRVNIQEGNKSTSAQIALGKGCIRDTALTPDGWKQSDAASPDGPFGAAVQELAATTDSKFSIAYAPSIVIMAAGGALEPNEYVKLDANGDPIAHNTGTDTEVKIFGRYLSKEGEITPTAAVATDNVRIQMGMG